MRKIPTPSSIGLTKTTCGDIYNAGGKRWFRATHKDQPGVAWYTNRHMAVDRLPPFKGCAVFADHAEPLKGKYELGGIIPRVAEPLVLVGETTIKGDLPVVEFALLVKGFLESVYLQTPYVELARWMYPGCEFSGNGSLSPVRIIHDGNVVGCIMPTRSLS